MGFYINTVNGQELPVKDKADWFLTHVAGTYQIYPPPQEWAEEIICVMENKLHDVAAYMFSQKELMRFQYPPDARRRTFLHVPGAAGMTPYGAMARDEAAGKI